MIFQSRKTNKMKKNIKILHYSWLILFALLITGCTDYEQNYPDADKPIITPESTTVSITEGETGFITLNLSKAIGSPIDLKMMKVGEDATAGDEDYTVDSADEYTSPDDGVGPVPAYKIVIPIGVTSFDIPISAIDDADIETDETVTFQLTSTGNGMGFIPEESQIITVTIINNVSDDFLARLSWNGTYVDADGDEHDLCDFDFDLEIYSQDLSETLATSYSSCPEEIRLSPGDLEDGTYWIVPSFWSNAGIPPAENIQFPAMMTFAQPGAQIVTEDLSTVWDYETGGAAEGAENAYYIDYILTVSGSNFTITDSDGNLLFEQ